MGRKKINKKKRETLEMIDEVLEVIGNPFEDMSIDEKKG